MNDAQLVETAKLIMNEFYFLKVSDLQLFFQRFKTGYYGQLFDRLDGSVIMVALREYCEEKQSAVVLVAAEIKQQEIINKEDYVLMLGESYIHETEDTYDTVKENELATKYTYREAMDIKMNVSKELKVVDSKKCEGGFFLANAKEEKKIKPSVNNIYNDLKSQGLKVSKDSLYLWLDYARACQKIAERHAVGPAEPKSLQRGIATISSYLKTNTDSPEAWLARAVLLHDSRQWTAAIADADRALAIDASLAEAHAIRGDALAESQDWPAAAAAFERVTAIELVHYLWGLNTNMPCGLPGIRRCCGSNWLATTSR